MEKVRVVIIKVLEDIGLKIYKMNNSKKKQAAFIGLGVLALLILPNQSKASTNTNTNTTGPTPPSGGVSPGAPAGDVNESFLGLGASTPRGIRNNNPGNLKIGNSPWQGKIPVSQNTDGTFEQFSTFPLGTRAMIKLLKNYILQGRDTPKKIIQFWDLGATHYTTFLVNETGYTENQLLQADKPTLKKLSQAIAKFENGQDILTDARFETAYTLL
jgi:hypothetical protein